MRHGLDRTLGLGAATMAAGGLAMVLAVAFGLTSAASLVLPMALYLAGLGMVLPQAIAGAMTPFPERAGAASALLGFVQQSGSALCGVVVGALLGQKRMAAGRCGGGDGLRDAAAMDFDARVTRARGQTTLVPAAPEQIVEQPAVEAAAARRWRIAGGLNRRRRRHTVRFTRRRIAAEQSRQHAGRRAGQGGDRNALMGAAHEAAPDFHRQRAAGDLFGRRAVVIAEPHAGDEMRRCSR